MKKFTALGAEVAVEKGAGEAASISDAEFESAGAKIASRADVLKGAGIILCVDGPEPTSLKGAEKGALLVGALDPVRRRDAIEAYALCGTRSPGNGVDAANHSRAVDGHPFIAVEPCGLQGRDRRGRILSGEPFR